MLEFVLSKINMLILVIAIFAIIAYFLFSLGDMMKVHESQLILSRLKDKADALVTSRTYCDSLFHYFPDSITVTGEHLYYVIKISTEVDDSDPNQIVNYMIFSVFPRKEFFSGKTPKALAAASVRTTADVSLFSYLKEAGIEESTESYTLVDPQAFPPSSALMLVKQVRAGEEYLHVIPCSTPEICMLNKDQASCLAAGHATDCDAAVEGEFLC